MFQKAVFVVDAVRTPIGKYKGALAPVRPDDLAAHVISALLQRHEDAAGALDQVIFGSTNQAGEDNRNVARMALLLAGVSHEVPGLTVNRLCGSGLEAVNDAARMILTGEASCVVAGGVESMTRAPFSMPKATEAFDRTPPEIWDTTIGWRYPNPKLRARYPLESMGETAENVAEKWGIGREEQDRFALSSQEKAGKAIADGAFADELVPVPLPPAKKADTERHLDRDESPRPDTTLEKLARLQPAFKRGGTVTAGNSSPLNDGAAALLLASEEVVTRQGWTPLARWMGSATAGVLPGLMGEGPIPATKKLAARLGLAPRDFELVELNEAFAAQSLACLRGLELDPARVNVHGGAIALGHPIGCSGARIAATLAWAMRRHGAQRGLATMCIGVGQGIATALERA